MTSYMTALIAWQCSSYLACCVFLEILLHHFNW